MPKCPRIYAGGLDHGTSHLLKRRDHPQKVAALCRPDAQDGIPIATARMRRKLSRRAPQTKSPISGVLHRSLILA